MKWVGWRGLSQLGVCPEQASKGGRSSRSHWGQVSEEAGQLSPASFWLGRPNPPDQWLLLRAQGEAEKPDWRSWGGQGPRGTVEDFFLEINCKERVHIILWELVLALFQRLLYQRQRPKLLKGGWAGVEIHTWAGRKCWKPVTTSLRKKTACLDALEVGRDALQWGNPLRDRKRPGAANLGPTCQEKYLHRGLRKHGGKPLSIQYCSKKLRLQEEFPHGGLKGPLREWEGKCKGGRQGSHSKASQPWKSLEAPGTSLSGLGPG